MWCVCNGSGVSVVCLYVWFFVFVCVFWCVWAVCVSWVCVDFVDCVFVCVCVCCVCDLCVVCVCVVGVYVVCVHVVSVCGVVFVFGLCVYVY